MRATYQMRDNVAVKLCKTNYLNLREIEATTSYVSSYCSNNRRSSSINLNSHVYLLHIGLRIRLMICYMQVKYADIHVELQV